MIDDKKANLSPVKLHSGYEQLEESFRLQCVLAVVPGLLTERFYMLDDIDGDDAQKFAGVAFMLANALVGQSKIDRMERAERRLKLAQVGSG